jgi:hypothetical protein
MLHKPCKVITDDNGTIKIYGNGHARELEYRVPDWMDEEDETEQSFIYKGHVYFLSEFLNTHNPVYFSGPDWMKEFDGYNNDSFFSGILIKLIGDEAVQVYTYIA